MQNGGQGSLQRLLPGAGTLGRDRTGLKKGRRTGAQTLTRIGGFLAAALPLLLLRAQRIRDPREALPTAHAVHPAAAAAVEAA